MSVTILSVNGLNGIVGINCGPFLDGNGNLYVVLDGPGLEMHKSDDYGDTWSVVDSAGEPTGTGNFGAFQDGTEIHVTHNNGTTIYYHRFHTSDDAAADSWEEIDTTVYTPGQGITNASFLETQIVVRSSGDRIIMVHEDEKIHGTNYSRPISIEWTSGGGWATPVQLGPTGGQEYWTVYAMALGEAGKIHFWVYDGPNTDPMHTSLADGSTTPSTREDFDTTYDSLLGPLNVYVDETGVESIKFAAIPSSGGELFIYEVRDDGTPETREALTSSEAPNDHGALIYASDHPTSARLIALYSDASTDDFWIREDTGSGWGGATEVLDAVTQGNTGVSANTYEKGNGDYVLGWVWVSGSNTVFDEYVLVAGGADTHTPLQSRIKAMRVSPILGR